ncbi:MAG: winged helix-turn-helix transcriptional regulator [Candidatus Woesearchaeota archaeon]
MKQDCYYEAKNRFTCNTQRALHVVGEKWMLYILREFLYAGEKQSFNKLMKELKPISSRTLSLKLKTLQERGLITRKVIDSQPVKIEYEITKQGKDLEKALTQFGNWFVKHHS